ncbi:uncharacterized protein N7459_006679 [Penicillium hispanicum]|uniref:uncharacterized protein n=1 Tax=Penicillium hispanicum TaxID=1080232 RepID=UPI0025404498|nr:uncharacterized protein N7459_006679 [Penicillium hispanicum]KAJ5577715.1 hypothetical protein N7459_006679 [Penicillium hispanicum]
MVLFQCFWAEKAQWSTVVHFGPELGLAILHELGMVMIVKQFHPLTPWGNDSRYLKNQIKSTAYRGMSPTPTPIVDMRHLLSSHVPLWFAERIAIASLGIWAAIGGGTLCITMTPPQEMGGNIARKHKDRRCHNLFPDAEAHVMPLLIVAGWAACVLV